MTRVRKILHPTDFSPASRPAFARALELAKADRAELLVAHAISPVAPLIGDGYISPQAFEELERAAHADSQKRLDALLRRTKAKGVRASGVVVDGAPWQAIVRLARARRADLIVMGTHGRSGLARFVLGSVAERVIASAPCPVLTLRAR